MSDSRSRMTRPPLPHFLIATCTAFKVLASALRTARGPDADEPPATTNRPWSAGKGREDCSQTRAARPEYVT
jgi:hypothetical protein